MNQFVIIIGMVGLKDRSVVLIWVWIGDYIVGIYGYYIRFSLEGFIPHTSHLPDYILIIKYLYPFSCL